ncbi:phosphate signaling complex protein PhoU [Desulfohalobium retbaense]|uniref:Phosphate-specific transport system accessory protein PhoU n=1 Tax=Desulfohalobium retbaense (strain ATCC 49708 / DSM 5692 / JCM 16813 / HR100) TaxID=485915 RepID=C8X0E2_DESRD|nr:phosphate signaling complex protein PhoU [Desulfohalobium retbaense]ACV67767.1 phosphate uptake regulator, PhoU [Desulfohalobium retbaense DSM 5692]
MQTHLQRELDKLKNEIMNMFALSERALEKALQSVFDRDDQLAETVIDGDKEINRLQVAVDERCVRLLALEQPVAHDLRFIVGCSRIAVDLERIGDQATNLAERALLLNQRPALPFHNILKALSDVVFRMFKQSIQAFTNLDTNQAVEVCKMDREADEQNIKIIKKLIDYMCCEQIVIERSVHTILASNSLERVGDLATNISETVVFIDEGEDIRHDCQLDPR